MSSDAIVPESSLFLATVLKAQLTHDNQFWLQGFEVYDVKGTNIDSQSYQKHRRADSEEKKEIKWSTHSLSSSYCQ